METTLRIGGEFFYCSDADWFVDYDIEENNTALVVEGSDGVGVLFLVLKNNHVKEFLEIVEKTEKTGNGVKGGLGECIRYAAQHKDIMPEKCTIGGVFSSILKMVKNRNNQI